jgi:hypothetical protein
VRRRNRPCQYPQYQALPPARAGWFGKTVSTLTRSYVSRETRAGSGHTLSAALLGFFVITLDATTGSRS